MRRLQLIENRQMKFFISTSILIRTSNHSLVQALDIEGMQKLHTNTELNDKNYTIQAF